MVVSALGMSAAMNGMRLSQSPEMQWTFRAHLSSFAITNVAFMALCFKSQAAYALPFGRYPIVRNVLCAIRHYPYLLYVYEVFQTFPVYRRAQEAGRTTQDMVWRTLDKTARRGEVSSLR